MYISKRIVDKSITAEENHIVSGLAAARFGFVGKIHKFNFLYGTKTIAGVTLRSLMELILTGFKLQRRQKTQLLKY